MADRTIAEEQPLPARDCLRRHALRLRRRFGCDFQRRQQRRELHLAPTQLEHQQPVQIAPVIGRRIARHERKPAAAPSGHDRDILHALHLIGHWRGHDRCPRLDPLEQGTSLRIPHIQPPANVAVDQQPRGCRQHARAVLPSSGVRRPHRLAGQRLDCPDLRSARILERLGIGGQRPHRIRHRRRERGERILHICREDQRRIVVQPARLQGLLPRRHEDQVPQIEHCRIIEPGCRIERSGMPVPRARCRRKHDLRPRGIVAVFRRQEWPPSCRIDSLGPVHPHQRIGLEQLAGRPVDHIEEAVLWRMEDHRTIRPIDLQMRQDQRLGGGEIPVVPRRLLIVPDHAARLGIERDEAAEIEIVPASRTALRRRIRPAIARADEEITRLGIERDRVPRRAAAADVPPAPGIPGLERGFKLRRLLRAQRGIAGHHMPAPAQLARLQIERRDIAAHIIFRAAHANHDNVARDLRRARRIVALLAVLDEVRLPDHRAGLCVQRIEPAVERRDVDLAPRHRDPAVDHVAARCPVQLHVDVGLERPELPARRRVERIGAPRHARRIEHPADHHRRRFHPPRGAKFSLPRQPEGADVLRIDARQRRMMRLARIPARACPLTPRPRHGRRSAKGAGGEESERKPADHSALPSSGHGLGIR